MRKNSLILAAILGLCTVLLFGGGCKNPFRKDEQPSLAGPVGAKATRDAVPRPAHFDGALPTTHTVKKGDTLWALASYYHGNGKAWSRIAEANRIQGTHIPVGMELTIPR